MNWSKIKHFSKAEFNCDTELLNPFALQALDKLRELYGKPIYPSPVKGAVVRFGGNPKSQHYVGEDKNHIIRHSKAIDIFPTGVPIEFLTYVLNSGLFSGIGMYLDTTGIDGKPWVMFHLDIRNKGFKPGVSLVWIAIKKLSQKTHNLKTLYHYPQINSSFWRFLKNEQMYQNRVKSSRKNAAKIN